jgi:hypothetical protein
MKHSKKMILIPFDKYQRLIKSAIPLIAPKITTPITQDIPEQQKITSIPLPTHAGAGHTSTKKHTTPQAVHSQDTPTPVKSVIDPLSIRIKQKKKPPPPPGIPKSNIIKKKKVNLKELWRTI